MPFLLSNIIRSGQGQASTDEDGRLRTVHTFIRPCEQRTENWAQNVHLMEKIRTLDQDYHLVVEEWTDF